MATHLLTTHAELAPYAAATLAINCPRDSRQFQRRDYHVVCYCANRRATSESRWSVLSESAARHQAQENASTGYTAEVWGPAGLLAVVLPSPPAATAPVEVAAPVEGPTYGVSYIASPAPATSLTYEAFCQHAIARVAAFSEFMQLPVVAWPAACHFPASDTLRTFTQFTVQAWERKPAGGGEPRCLAYASSTTSAEACLTSLGDKLRDLEQQAVAADPSLGMDAAIEAYAELANCAQL